MSKYYGRDGIKQILDYLKNELLSRLLDKQDKLTFDNTPTKNSNNPVKSNGIYNSTLTKVTSMPSNPSDGDLVIWNGATPYVSGHIYKYVAGPSSTLYAWQVDNPGGIGDGTVIYTKSAIPNEDTNIYKSDGTAYSSSTDDPTYELMVGGESAITIEIFSLSQMQSWERGANRDSSNDITVSSGEWTDISLVSSAYHHAGTKTVAQLTSSLLVAANEGNVYNITDSGTTTADFIEGAGKPINEGSNVGIANVGNNTYKFDLLSGVIDDSNLAHTDINETITGYWTFDGYTYFNQPVQFDGGLELNYGVSFNDEITIDNGYIYLGEVGQDPRWYNYINYLGQASLSSLNVSDIYATTITFEEFNGELDMYDNDITNVRSITGWGSNSITIGSVSINDQNISNVLSLEVSNISCSSGNIMFDNDIDMDGNTIYGVHEIYPTNNSIIFNSDETYMDELIVNTISTNDDSNNVNFITEINMNGNTINGVRYINPDENDDPIIINDNGETYMDEVYLNSITSRNNEISFYNDINLYSNNIDDVNTITAQNYQSAGSDYAENFEELEPCPKYRFVTLKGNKIKLAQSPDDYILGITSNNPSFIGDKNNKGIPVGLLGKLWVEQDGTAEVDKYVTVKENGIATKSNAGYRVMEIDGNKVRIIFK